LLPELLANGFPETQVFSNPTSHHWNRWLERDNWARSVEWQCLFLLRKSYKTSIRRFWKHQLLRWYSREIWNFKSLAAEVSDDFVSKNKHCHSTDDAQLTLFSRRIQWWKVGLLKTCVSGEPIADSSASKKWLWISRKL
jgi:hypothetical protein